MTDGMANLQVKRVLDLAAVKVKGHGQQKKAQLYGSYQDNHGTA